MITEEKKYVYVKNYILNGIKDGKFNKGSKLPAENKLAENLEVSRHTVRKALYELEKDHIIYKVKGSGNYISDLTEKKDIFSVGFVIQHLTNYIFPFIAMGIEEELYRCKCQILMGNASENPEKEYDILNNWLAEDISGFIVDPVYSGTDQSNREILREISIKKPLLLINSDLDIPGAGVLVLDDYESGKKAAKLFLENNHERLAVVYKATHKPGVMRAKGFVDYLKEQNINFVYELPFYKPELSAIGISMVTSLLTLNENQRPTGIFCFNDVVAMQTYLAAQKLGIKIPTDLSVISFDNSTLAEALQLTSFNHPKEKFGKRAVKMLIDQINGELPQKIVEKAELVVRKSLAPRK